MKCMKCQDDFEEKDIQESHGVPCYLFEGKKRNIKKNQADKYFRTWLCLKCHRNYELALAIQLINIINKPKDQSLISFADKFSIKYFKGDCDGNRF